MALEPGSIWLDGRGAQSVAHSGRGIPRHVSELIPALVEAAPDAIGAIGLDPSQPVPPALARYEQSGLLVEHGASPPVDRPAPDIFHLLSPFEADLSYEEIWPPWIRDSRCRLVATLHDLVPVVMREQYLAEWGYRAVAWTARLGLMRCADQVLTISSQTAADATEYLGLPEERLTVIDSGVSDHFSSLVDDRQQAESLVRSELRGVRPGFLLYVGGTDYRKNLEGTVLAYARLSPELRRAHQLVIACEIPFLRRQELKAQARSLGVEAGQMALVGYVTDRQLAALYRSCALFVFSSLYEGAGLPILEAMSCDAPVAVSGVSAMPELLGDDDATFDPADPDDMAHCIGDVLATPGRLELLRERSRRQARIHTWERVARKTLDGYARSLVGAPSYRLPA
jgi:glycosyltransferase involved in cell wall biosynthesis